MGQRTAPMLCRFLSTPSARRATPALPWTTTTVRNFYPRPPRGGRLKNICLQANLVEFLSTPSARRATKCKRGIFMNTQISIHALREEGDVEVSDGKGSTSLFLSTPSARRATRARAAVAVQLGISIHALREEGDMLCVIISNMTTRISIHALREEGDTFPFAISLSDSRFLSTPSARRATSGVALRWHSKEFLSTPSARRATQKACLFIVQGCISIHALREEGDHVRNPEYPQDEEFLSTPSARRATGTSRQHDRAATISIHALREEGDKRHRRCSPSRFHFYPRPPRGGRRGCC